jgi:hypothetical protein
MASKFRGYKDLGGGPLLHVLRQPLRQPLPPSHIIEVRGDVAK